MTPDVALPALDRRMREVGAMPMDVAPNPGHPHAARHVTAPARAMNPCAGIERMLHWPPAGATG